MDQATLVSWLLGALGSLFLLFLALVSWFAVRIVKQLDELNSLTIAQMHAIDKRLVIVETHLRLPTPYQAP